MNSLKRDCKNLVLRLNVLKIDNMNKEHIAAIILAAGRGKRMNLPQGNKVTATLASKPIILHIVQFMQNLLIKSIVIVVGHAKESVMDVLKEEHVIFAEQTEQLGTGDALKCGVDALPENITDVFVVYGDDAVFYNHKHLPIVKELFAVHGEKKPAITFLTIEQDNPVGLGRIVRDKDGQVVKIMEEKDATEEQKLIKEINPGCFVFSVSFLKEFLPQLPRSEATGEYYLTSLIDVALQNNQKVETVQGGKLAWRGVNTPEELKEAEKLFLGLN